MARWRIPTSDHFAVSFGGGWSGGKYEWHEFAPGGDHLAEKRMDHANWLNIDASIEQAWGGFRLREFIGFATLLNPSGLACYHREYTSDDTRAHCLESHSKDGWGAAYIGFAAGYAF